MASGVLDLRAESFREVSRIGDFVETRENIEDWRREGVSFFVAPYADRRRSQLSTRTAPHTLGFWTKPPVTILRPAEETASQIAFFERPSGCRPIQALNRRPELHLKFGPLLGKMLIRPCQELIYFARGQQGPVAAIQGSSSTLTWLSRLSSSSDRRRRNAR